MYYIVHEIGLEHAISVERSCASFIVKSLSDSLLARILSKSYWELNYLVEGIYFCEKPASELSTV